MYSRGIIEVSGAKTVASWTAATLALAGFERQVPVVCFSSHVLFHWVSIALALGGIRSLCETPVGLRGRGNVTRASVSLVLSSKKGEILSELPLFAEASMHQGLQRGAISAPAVFCVSDLKFGRLL